MTVTGSGFTGATKVAFGGVTATSFNVVSDTQITAVSPAQSGAHYIVVMGAWWDESDRGCGDLHL